MIFVEQPIFYENENHNTAYHWSHVEKDLDSNKLYNILHSFIIVLKNIQRILY